LGPIGGGLIFGAASPSTVGVAAASSDALTTSLELVFFVVVGYITMFILDANKLVFLLPETLLGDNANPEAADAMLQLAMIPLYVFVDNLKCGNIIIVAKIKDKNKD
jgi:hypothetical protein